MAEDMRIICLIRRNKQSLLSLENKFGNLWSRGNEFGFDLHIKECIFHHWIISEHVPGEVNILTHWGRVTHICVGKPAIIGSDNGLSPDRRQAIIWTNAGILLIGPLGTYFSEILTGIQTFSFKKMHLKMSSAKWCSFCLGLNELIYEMEGLIENYSALIMD